MASQKYIALIDCDSFFVSCERVLTPELNGEPVCVVSGERGCVISRSREAKKQGVPMGIPLFQACEQFPNSIYLKANHRAYSKISKKVMNVLKDISPNVEVYSIDEAFVDFTGLKNLYKRNYFELAKMVQERVMQEAGVPVSVGISRTKTLAKLASDRAKDTPQRVVLLGSGKIKKFLDGTDIKEVWGIGYRLAKKLNGFGIKTALDYVKRPESWVKSKFGKNGIALSSELMGVIVSPISNSIERPKSISASRAFSEFSSDINFIKNELSIHIHETCARLRKINCKCRNVGVMLNRKDFKKTYNKIKLNVQSDFEFEISKYAFSVLDEMYEQGVLYRSVGVVLEDFDSIEQEQLLLFDDNPKRKQEEKLGKCLDNLEKRFGRNIVRTGFVNKDVPFKQGFLTHPKEE